ncbi:MAG: hypothetical protein ABIF87_13585 [Pseudomonadota bacterium]
MTFDPNTLLTAEEFAQPRTPAELSYWVEDKCRTFAQHREAKEWILLHKGLFQKFYEEIYPLSLFVNHLYAGRADIKCAPNLDNRDFDATITDYSVSPPSEIKIEITSAIEKNPHLRMEYFVEHGHVNVWGPLSSSGTKKTGGHKIHVENQAIAHNELLGKNLSFIREAVKRKTDKSTKVHKYGQGHVLIVFFDDWQWFEPVRDGNILKDFMERNVLTSHIDFAALYILGLSGKSFIRFDLIKI